MNIAFKRQRSVTKLVVHFFLQNKLQLVSIFASFENRWHACSLQLPFKLNFGFPASFICQSRSQRVILSSSRSTYFCRRNSCCWSADVTFMCKRWRRHLESFPNGDILIKQIRVFVLVLNELTIKLAWRLVTLDSIMHESRNERFGAAFVMKTALESSRREPSNVCRQQNYRALQSNLIKSLWQPASERKNSLNSICT